MPTITIPVSCPHCQRPMSLSMQPPALGSERPKTDQAVQCPYSDCGYEMHLQLHGQIIGAWKGHRPEAAPRM